MLSKSALSESEPRNKSALAMTLTGTEQETKTSWDETRNQLRSIKLTEQVHKGGILCALNLQRDKMTSGVFSGAILYATRLGSYFTTEDDLFVF